MKDTANILSPSGSQKSSSEREIQKLDTVVSSSLGEQFISETRSDRVNLVSEEGLTHRGKASDSQEESLSSVCSTVGPSASMWVPAPYQNSVLVLNSDLHEPPASP